MVAVLVTAMLSLVRTSGMAFAQDVLGYKALLAADSGAQLTLNRIYAPAGVGNCAGATWVLDMTGLESCQATVTCSTELVSGDTYYTVDSYGRCTAGPQIAERRIRVRSVE